MMHNLGLSNDPKKPKSINNSSIRVNYYVLSHNESHNYTTQHAITKWLSRFIDKLCSTNNPNTSDHRSLTQN